ncbi:hypothetical protein C8Q74DRAFT_1312711 [Fomes fomentarius]|nr:hypothetical protein C8Q74DRAFT_1312711 [Fomes fomentarius]
MTLVILCDRRPSSSRRSTLSSLSQHSCTKPVELSPETVPLGSGLPTREELLLKVFVNSGDLGLLKRDKRLQARYLQWAGGIKEQYGTIVSYLMNYRLQWGGQPAKELPPMPPNAPTHFVADAPPELIFIAMNDWPYSVPPEIEHSLIWTRLPIYPPSLPPPSELPSSLPQLLPECLPSLADWGVTMDKLIRPRGTEEEERQVKAYGEEMEKFIKRRWSSVNGRRRGSSTLRCRLQSVPGLAHIHEIARASLAGN